jgi:opine dehydrogenase
MSNPTKRRLAVLGGGNTAFALAANLSLRGHEVVLWEAPDHASSIAPLLADPTISLLGVAERGRARIHRVTTDIREAAGEDLLLAPVPSYAHRPFADLLLPHLRPGHVLALLPGNLGSLFFAREARALGRAEGVLFAEVDTAPYVCRKTGAAEATIWGVVSGLGLGVYPARETARALAAVADLFPGLRAYPSALACGLSAGNPVVHPAGVLLNAGRIERSRGEFYFYEEGVTPGVARAIEAVDRERLAVGAAYGLALDSVAETFWKAGFGPRGDIWATINGSRMLTALRAPGSLDTRWLTEDIPFGIATWCLLGEERGIETPVMRALVALGSAVTGHDFWRSARTPADLDLAGPIAQLAGRLGQGSE